MLSQPAQCSYRTVYIINNLYEPVPWLKHMGNALVLLELQTPSPGVLELISIRHLVASQY